MAKVPRAKHEERLHNHWQTPWLTRPTAEHLKILGLRNFIKDKSIMWINFHVYADQDVEGFAF